MSELSPRCIDCLYAPVRFDEFPCSVCNSWNTVYEPSMTGTVYQKAAMRTAAPDCKNLSNAALGLAGEAGEVADLIKKHLYQGHDLDKEKIKKELGDCLWYVALMCECCGFTMDDVMELNIEKLKKRYPDGFDAERSVNRGSEDD